MRLPSLLIFFLVITACSSAGTDHATTRLVNPPLTPKGTIYLELAQNYLQVNDLESALNNANDALASDPGSSDVQATLALIYDRIGDKAKAAAYFKRALQLSPNKGTILNAYGAWLCGKKQYAEADAQFTKALQDPFYKSPDEALFNTGRCAQAAGQLVKAEYYYRTALTRAPQSPAILFGLAEVEFAQGKYMDARAFVQRRDALGADPVVLDLAARIEDAAGDRAAAARYRTRLAQEFPNFVPSASGGR